METQEETIQVGEYVIIQRQDYTKLHKFSNLDTTATLGKDLIELREIAGHPFFTTFKMIRKEGDKKRIFTLEPCTNPSNLKPLLESIKESGTDNRNIVDEGHVTGFSADEIKELREKCSSSTEILGALMEKSKTFNSKTEYAQEKYLRKKEKKYFEYIQIRRPSIRLLSDIYYRQDPEKIMGLRMDTLSQIISYSNVSAMGNFLLYESGTNGLLPAALLNSIGAGTEGKLLHMHPGNFAQKQALMALNLPQEQRERCVSVNIYSSLRQFYQGDEVLKRLEKKEHKAEEEDAPPSKKQKTEEGGKEREWTKPKWYFDNLAAVEMMKERLDSLIIVSKEHPMNILKALLPFVAPSRPVVVFNTSREILAELYVELKSSYPVTALRLTSNWMRNYQILPNRTHPEVMTKGSSGYLLCGYTISTR